MIGGFNNNSNSHINNKGLNTFKSSLLIRLRPITMEIKSINQKEDDLLKMLVVVKTKTRGV